MNETGLRIGLSTCGKCIGEELFREYRDAGIQDMELSMTWEEYETLDYQKLSIWSAEYQVRIRSCHLPFFPFSMIEISDEAAAEETIGRFEKIIRKGAEIGIKIYVVHPSGEPIGEEERPQRMACAGKSLARLADIAAESGAVIAVENLPRTCLGRDSGELLELLCAHSGLSVCFDTNHLLDEDMDSFLGTVGNKIITIHVSDYDFLNERHWMPGEGEIDWKNMLTKLRKTGYQGPWMYEVAYEPTATIERRPFCAMDFAKNAKEIFEGRRPEPLGKKKEHLRSWKTVKK